MFSRNDDDHRVGAFALSFASRRSNISIESRFDPARIGIGDATRYRGIKSCQPDLAFLNQPYALAQYLTLGVIATGRNELRHELFERFPQICAHGHGGFFPGANDEPSITVIKICPDQVEPYLRQVACRPFSRSASAQNTSRSARRSTSQRRYIPAGRNAGAYRRDFPR